VTVHDPNSDAASVENISSLTSEKRSDAQCCRLRYMERNKNSVNVTEL
jgi:hypothetical protein